MSLNIKPSGEKASQLLNFNMENISHELDALIIGGELDGLGANGSIPINGNASQAAAYKPCVGPQLNSYVFNSIAISGTDGSTCATGLDCKDTQILQLYLQNHYQQQLHQQQLLQQQHQQLQPSNIFQHANYNSIPSLYDVGSFSSVVTESQLTPRFDVNINNNYSSASRQPNPMQHDGQLNTCIVTGGVSVKYSPSPKFEFHFLRCQSSNRHSADTNAMPLISSAARSEPETEFYNSNIRRSSGGVGGANGVCTGQRKYMKQQTDGANMHEIDYDKIVVDMSLLALSVNNKELNPVLRLFGLFRKTHYYLNDVLPESFVLEYTTLTPSKYSMPCTMNVQYQVKQVARKCTIFLFEMQRLINANKIYSLDMYLECEESLNLLRTLLTQVEAYKRIEMEHKRGQFVTEEAQVQSEKLEQHLQQLTDQIRETHIYVHGFNWAVERANKSTTYNEIKEHQTGTAVTYEWTSNVASSIYTPLTNCDIIQNEINIDVSIDGGASTELLCSPGNYGRQAPILTANCGDFDIERQSTRYIGYK